MTVPLPSVPDAATVTAVRAGNNQTLSSNLLIRQEPRVLNINLENREIPRPVVSPVISDMPGYPGHMWGAVNGDVDNAGDGRIVHFADSMAAATNPPQMRLVIITTWGEALVVEPRIGSQHVSVGDVQRTIIAWMRTIEQAAQTRGQRTRLTRRIVVRARDGTVMEVEVWMWRGLVRVGGSIGIWAIQL